METLGLKSINMLSKEQYENIEQPAHDELYVVSHSGIGFPSNNYDDLELGASGSTYTAPANGYYCVTKKASAVDQYLDMFNTTAKIRLQTMANTASSYCIANIQARKGDVVQINYNLGGADTNFRFIYAEGE